MDAPMIRALTGSSHRPQLTFQRSYRASPDEVREACTDPRRLARWFGTIDGAPAAVGDTFTAVLSEDPHDRAEGRVLRCDDDILTVAWSWQGEPESTITARITAVDAHTTELTLHHALAQPDHAVGYGGGWEQMLQALARALGAAGQDAPADAQIEEAAAQTWRSMTRAPLELEHHLPAPIERVWAAIATPEGLRTWWWRHWDDVRIAADVRGGGHYRIEAPAVGIELDGSYLVVAEPEHLAFTWRWQDADGLSSDEAVDIRLTPQGDGTRLALRHTGPWTDDGPAENYRQGWDFVLGELASSLQR